jgi:hypothetical protein
MHSTPAPPGPVRRTAKTGQSRSGRPDRQPETARSHRCPSTPSGRRASCGGRWAARPGPPASSRRRRTPRRQQPEAGLNRSPGPGASSGACGAAGAAALVLDLPGCPRRGRQQLVSAHPVQDCAHLGRRDGQGNHGPARAPGLCRVRCVRPPTSAWRTLPALIISNAEAIQFASILR